MRERGAPPDDTARLARELFRLDPWSYWIVPAPAGEPGDFVVVGTTGAFFVASCVNEGGASEHRGHLTIAGEPWKELGRVRRAGARLGKRLSAEAVPTDVVPVVCLTRAVAGAPRTIRGVRVVAIADLVADVVGREPVLDPTRAERAARKLGVVLARETRGEGSEEAG